MSVFKIFPEKSATIYSYYPIKNTGIDEILEVSLYDNLIFGIGDVSRALIKFSTEQINEVLQNKVSGSNYSASLKMYLADASSIPLDYTLYCYPISADWDRGTGRATVSPQVTNGVSWTYRYNSSTVQTWASASFGVGITGSYLTSSNPGGGTWYTDYAASQSFLHNDSKDIIMNVTPIISAIYSGSISNHGFIIKNANSVEFTTGSAFELKYFSANSHTIYPPCLEIKWDDSSYVTGSLSTVTSTNIVTTIANNVGEYIQGSIQRFKINTRDRNPTRTFQTSSVYLNNKLLPSSSYWSIKDLDNEEIIIDFDTDFTKISADSEGNYFDVFMEGLQPERYYKILIKTIISGSILILDNNYIFKVIK